MSKPSYHDLFITTDKIKRTSIFNLPFGLEVACTKAAGWCLWRNAWAGQPAEMLAGEYDDCGLRLDVAGHVIIDSLGDGK
jgi:hypothetical protein